jgi:predicted SAM-dependent methyltransferase
MEEGKEIIQLNLGSGNRPKIPGFTHIDYQTGENVDLVGDIGNLPMYQDNSVSLIYASHSFEYFHLDEAPHVLKEWRRVLKPGGILRLSVPDFTRLIEVYKKSGDIRKILGPLYGRWAINDIYEVYHRTVYDYSLLTELLKEAGFTNIHKYSWWEREQEKYDDYSRAHWPHDPEAIKTGIFKPGSIPISLNVEASK